MKATVLKPLQKTSTCDNIGNRTSSEGSGQTTEYQANNLNQYSQTTINSTTNNCSYDADGNMLTNGDWTYIWNGENRMVSASNTSHVITFAYDFQGRCYEKVKDAVTNNYIWDDFNIITEISSAHTNQNVWGLDIAEQSGAGKARHSSPGATAGGVGGLLATAQDGAIYFTAFDANGNICQYVNTSGTTVANREYSPFGKTLALTGSKKDDFTHWFSTKPWDADAEMAEYEYRKLLVEMGRWVSREHLREMGSINLYDFTLNDPLLIVDLLGLINVLPGSNYTGPSYTAGEKGSWENMSPQDIANNPPTSRPDANSKAHDKCYADCRSKYKCNREKRLECFNGCDRTLRKANREIKNKTLKVRLMVGYINTGIALSEGWRGARVFPSSQPQGTLFKWSF